MRTDLRTNCLLQQRHMEGEVYEAVLRKFQPISRLPYLLSHLEGTIKPYADFLIRAPSQGLRR